MPNPGSPAAIRFRNVLEQQLAVTPKETDLGTVVGTEVVRFGAPGAYHETTQTWLLTCNVSALTMRFGFVPNFTNDDLMCKVTASHESVRDGDGASIQFNGAKAFEIDREGHVLISHHGRVTLSQAISRAKLVSGLRDLAPEVLDYFSLSNVVEWPVPLGTTGNLEQLLDALLVWNYGVEQVKRSLRGQALLRKVAWPEGMRGHGRLLRPLSAQSRRRATSTE